MNTDGSYKCKCNQGYQGNHHNCTGNFMDIYFPAKLQQSTSFNLAQKPENIDIKLPTIYYKHETEFDDWSKTTQKGEQLFPRRDPTENL